MTMYKLRGKTFLGTSGKLEVMERMGWEIEVATATETTCIIEARKGDVTLNENLGVREVPEDLRSKPMWRAFPEIMLKCRAIDQLFDKFMKLEPPPMREGTDAARD